MTPYYGQPKRASGSDDGIHLHSGRAGRANRWGSKRSGALRFGAILTPGAHEVRLRGAAVQRAYPGASDSV